MPPSEWARIVSASVVPVVIISACGLLCLALYNRLAAIVSRLRGFQRERLREQELMRQGGDSADAERRRKVIAMLETQTSHVVRRARLIRASLMFLLVTIAAMIACSMALGLSVVAPAAVCVAVPIFALGLLSMLLAIILAMAELKAALQPVELETRLVSELLHDGTTDPDAADIV